MLVVFQDRPLVNAVRCHNSIVPPRDMMFDDLANPARDVAS